VKVLLDTCVISELKRESPNQGVVASINEIPSENLFLSVITMGEIVKGIYLLDESTRKRSLQTWLLGLEQRYKDRILAIDNDTVRIWGELTAENQKQGMTIPASDGLIAATAQRHGLHLMTRNIADFATTGALLINPWST
jgi:toxin FitB